MRKHPCNLELTNLKNFCSILRIVVPSYYESIAEKHLSGVRRLVFKFCLDFNSLRDHEMPLLVIETSLLGKSEIWSGGTIFPSNLNTCGSKNPP